MSNTTAICFFGAFSQLRTAQSLRIEAANKSISDITLRSIFRNLDTKADVYVHSWTKWPTENLPNLQAAHIESNIAVRHQILSILNACGVLNLTLWQKILRSTPELSAFSQALYNQISAAISRSRVLRLVEGSGKKYENIIMIRPDVLVLSKITPKFVDGSIWTNASPTTAWGDFYYTFKSSDSNIFHDFAKSLKPDFLPLPHYGFPNHVFRNGKKIVSDDIIAGRDIEVYRKVAIPVRQYSRKITDICETNEEADLLASLYDNEPQSEQSWMEGLNAKYLTRFESPESFRGYLDKKFSFFNTVRPDDPDSVISSFPEIEAIKILLGIAHAFFQIGNDDIAIQVMEEHCLPRLRPENIQSDPWVWNQIVMCSEHYKMNSRRAPSNLALLRGLLHAIPSEHCDVNTDHLKKINLSSLSLLR